MPCTRWQGEAVTRDVLPVPWTPEAIIVMRDIFRRYPNKYEHVIGTLCDNLDTLDNSEAKASMVWIIGEYAERIDNAADLLDGFLEGFSEEGQTVQLQLLTATVKLFLKRPQVAQEMVKRVLALVTHESDSPDVRDRGYMYWRLLSMDPQAAKAIVCSQKPTIQDDTNLIETNLLDELVANLSNLASVYHKRPSAFVDRKKAVPEADDYEEAEEPEEVEEAAKGSAASAAAPPTVDFLSLDDPPAAATRGAEEAHASATRPPAPAKMDVLEDLLGVGSVPSSSVIPPAAAGGTRALLSDLLSAPAPAGRAGAEAEEQPVLLSADKAAGLCLRGLSCPLRGVACWSSQVGHSRCSLMPGCLAQPEMGRN